MSDSVNVDLRQAAEESDASRRIEIYPPAYTKELLKKKAEEAGLPLAFMGLGAYAAFDRMIDLLYGSGIALLQCHDAQDRKILDGVFSQNKGYRIKLNRVVKDEADPE